MRVYNQFLLPADKGLFCLNSKVELRNNVAYDYDTTQLCIEKQVLGAKKVPSTGPELGLAILMGNIFFGSSGKKLRKQRLLSFNNTYSIKNKGNLNNLWIKLNNLF